MPNGHLIAPALSASTITDALSRVVALFSTINGATGLDILIWSGLSIAVVLAVVRLLRSNT